MWIKFREATIHDVDAIMALVQLRIDWMNAVGLHQWNETDYFGRYPRSYWEKNIDFFLVHILRLDSAIGNQVLERYYTQLGYTPCGICHDRLYHGVLREKVLHSTFRQSHGEHGNGYRYNQNHNQHGDIVNDRLHQFVIAGRHFFDSSCQRTFGIGPPMKGVGKK